MKTSELFVKTLNYMDQFCIVLNLLVWISVAEDGGSRGSLLKSLKFKGNYLWKTKFLDLYLGVDKLLDPYILVEAHKDMWCKYDKVQLFE